MTDNELLSILITTIKEGMAEDGFENVPVVQAFQPTQQGVNTQPTIFLNKRKDYWYGWKESNNIYDIEKEEFTVVERQRVETTFAVRALATQDPTNVSLPTASDLVNEVGNILRSQKTLENLASMGLGVLRTADAQNEYDLDDRDQFEASPTFMITLVHSRVRTTKIPIVSSVDSVFKRV